MEARGNSGRSAESGRRALSGGGAWRRLPPKRSDAGIAPVAGDVAVGPDRLQAITPRPKRVSSQKLVLSRVRSLREGMISAFDRALAATRRAARAASSDPVVAVHEYRKSIRRARALIELLGPALGPSAARGVTRELRDAFRGTGTLRDTDVLLETLGTLDESGAWTEIRAILVRGAAEVADAAETTRLLRDGATRLRKLPAVLSVILESDYGPRRLEAGLTRLARRTREALDRADRSGELEDFHRWRKRVKEIRYVIELLASTGSRALKDRERRLADLARDLGSVTDLVILRQEIVRRSTREEIPEPAALLRAIDEKVYSSAAELRGRARELLSETPKGFARAVLAQRG